MVKSRTIRKAVVPAAGLGTRLQTLTSGAPKEMLPVGGKPLIAHIVDEAVAAGLDQICVVIREGKEEIRDYLCSTAPEADPRYEPASTEHGRTGEFAFVFQPRPLGLGDALLQAKDFVGDDPFLMMIPDQLLLAEASAAQQLIDRYEPGQSVWSSLLRLSKTDVPFFGGARGVDYLERDGQIVIQRLQTEEETEKEYRDCDFELRGFGRTIYPPEIFDYLGLEYVNPRTAEVDLWRTFQACGEKFQLRGVLLQGEPLDFGTAAGYHHYLPRFQSSKN